MAQLARIRAIVKQKWSLKEKNEEKDGNNKEGSNDGSRES